MSFFERISVRLTKHQLRQMEELVRLGIYNSKSEIIRYAVSELLNKYFSPQDQLRMLKVEEAERSEISY